MPILANLHKGPVGNRGVILGFLYGGLPLPPQVPAADPVPRQFPVPMVLGLVGKFRINGPLYPTYAPTVLRITGVTRDSTGAALASCTVKLFRTADDVVMAATVSDASGNYEFRVGSLDACYAVSYKAGSPDVTGATVNTLVGA